MLFVVQYCSSLRYFFFFFNDTATTEIYTLSLHDALPISHPRFPGRAVPSRARLAGRDRPRDDRSSAPGIETAWRSEEHTSELQSRLHLVCRLLLEKKKRRPEHQSYGHATTHHHVYTCTLA